MITVCWKWISADGDPRWAGVSDADQAALEMALRLAAAEGSDATGPYGGVRVLAAGPAGAERILRHALAVGATEVERIDIPITLESRAVARSLAGAIRDRSEDTTWVICGDYSLDRGSGSVPAFIAAALDRPQALGLVGLEIGHNAAELRGIRRLDGGRREVLELRAPAVLSVEGSLARLRRARIADELQAQRATIPVRPGPREPLDSPLSIHPYRPRPRVLPAPRQADTLSRVRELTGDTAGHHGETVVLEPADAARRIVDQLSDWGYLDASAPEDNARHSER